MYEQFSPLAKLANDVKVEKMSPELLLQTKLIILDNLGVTIAGNAMAEQVGLAKQYIYLGGIGEASILGTAYRTSAPFAAMVNASGTVSTELDEGCSYATGHPGSYMMAAAWAVAEATDVPGKRLLEAALLGYEVNTRVARSSKLRETVHPHGTTGTVGAAGAAGYLLGQDEETLKQTMSLGAGMAICSSQLAAMKGATVRNIENGLSAQNGVYAAYLPQCGFNGEDDAMTTSFGRNLGSAFDEKWLYEGLPNGEFYIMRNYFKMYACSRWNHAPVDCAMVLREKLAGRIDEIDHYEIATYDPATRLSWPEPTTVFGTRFSIPYTVAVSLVTGDCGLKAFSEEMMANKTVMDLAARGRVVEDPEYTAMIPELRPARVTIWMKDGSKLEESCFKAKGEWTNPFSTEELHQKFFSITSPVIGADAAKKAIASVMDLEHVASVRQLIRDLK